MKNNNIKLIKINSQILKNLSIILHSKLNNPNVSNMLSVSKVSVSNDLKVCVVYVCIFDNDKNKKQTIKILNSSKGYIKRELAVMINFRNIPDLIFKIDNSMEENNKIVDLLNKVLKDGKK